MSPSHASLNDQQRAAYIRKQVIAHDSALRQRTFCLHFVSSTMHYYGDVEPGNAIHHFVVKEPFCIPQLSVPFAHQVMREI